VSFRKTEAIPFKLSRCKVDSCVGGLLPEEVLTAEEAAVSREALVCQRTATLAALDALGVPHAVENVQQEPVEDRTVAAGAQ